MLHDNKVDKQDSIDTLNLVRIILQQNYFQYKDSFYKPKTGIAMGSPLSGIVAEIFLQHWEGQLLKHAMENKSILYYTRYVDNIFIIYNQEKISPLLIQEQFDSQHKAIHFTATEENNNQIAYLDLNIANRQGHIEIDIFRKPTTTDTTINSASCHLGEHKMATFKNWLHRMYRLPLSKENREKELNTIIGIVENNGYNGQQIIKLDNTVKAKKPLNKDSKEGKKWVTFTYTGNYIHSITKLFKHKEVKIAYKTGNTVSDILKDTYITSKFDQAGIYKLMCMDCNKVYIGQTGRTLRTRYKEHIRSIKYNKEDSGYITHILNNTHNYGTIEDVMEKIDQAKRGRIMNIEENLHIYIYKKQNKLIEEQKMKVESSVNGLFDIMTMYTIHPTKHKLGRHKLSTYAGMLDTVAPCLDTPTPGEKIGK
jgi:hypothetical protein